MSFIPYIMAGTSVMILLLDRIKLALGLLLAQYALAFIISLPVLPIRTLLARLIGGILTCAILYTSESRFRGARPIPEAKTLPRSLWFRLITSLIVFIVAWALANEYQTRPSTQANYVLVGAIFNICLGSLMIGLYQSPLEAAIGLLILLVGFDLFYGGIEPSLAIVVLMISIQMIISLATSYMMSVAQTNAGHTRGDL